jgi:hypothetical protein
MATGQTGIYMFGGLVLKSAKVTNDFFELVGDASMADKAPLSADCNPTFFSHIMLHGIFMVLAWGFFLPWGAFIARHMKHREPLWFHLHRLFQVTGLLLAIAGIICAILSVQFDHVTFVHAIIGTAVMIIGIQQPMNAIIRCPKPEEGERKTLRRAVWEFTHHFLGHGAIYLGLANICLGIFLAMATQIIWIVWFAYLGFLLIAHVVAEMIRQYRWHHGNLEENLKLSTVNKYVINDSCENAYEEH